MRRKIFFLVLFFSLPTFAWAGLVDINTAGLEELDKIPEVGATIAQRIIDYRTVNGPFKEIEEIQKVKGIGSGVTYSKMRDFITVGSGNSGQTSSNEIEEKGDSKDDGTPDSEQTEASNKTGSFKLSLDKERLATVRTPITFSVSPSKKGKISNSFNWSFGDGTSAYGLKVSHAYQYPGRYNVVLNGSIDQTEEAVARTTVLVVEAKLKITEINPNQGYVEISNQGDKEQNLNGWRLQLGRQAYNFPMDTIISPKSTIKIPVNYLGFNLAEMTEIVLAYPDGGAISKAILQEGADPTMVAEVKTKLQDLKQQLALTKTNSEVTNEKAPVKQVLTKNSPLAKNVVTLKRELSWFEKIRHAIFE